MAEGPQLTFHGLSPLVRCSWREPSYVQSPALARVRSASKVAMASLSLRLTAPSLYLAFSTSSGSNTL